MWFFSLDATNRFAVRIARLVFHLPSYDARMSSKCSGDTVRYTSRDRHTPGNPGQISAHTQGLNLMLESQKGVCVRVDNSPQTLENTARVS